MNPSRRYGWREGFATLLRRRFRAVIVLDVIIVVLVSAGAIDVGHFSHLLLNPITASYYLASCCAGATIGLSAGFEECSVQQRGSCAGRSRRTDPNPSSSWHIMAPCGFFDDGELSCFIKYLNNKKVKDALWDLYTL